MRGLWERSRRAELRFISISATVVVALVVGVTTVAYLFAQRVDVDFSYLSRDAAAVLDASAYAGAFALLTILIWCVPVVVALFVSYVLYRVGESEPSWMLLVAGLITTTMVLDDAFQVHEFVTFHLGTPGGLAPVVYGLATAAFAWRFRRRLGLHLLVVVATFAAWGVSATIDTVLSMAAPFVVEDGAKLLGVGLWALVIVRVCLVELGHVLRAHVGVTRGYVDASPLPTDGSRHRAHRPAPVPAGDRAEILAASGLGSHSSAPYLRPRHDGAVPDLEDPTAPIPARQPLPFPRDRTQPPPLHASGRVEP